jgi:hypothetical protein
MCRRPYLPPRNTVPESRSLSAKINEAYECMRKSNVKYRSSSTLRRWLKKAGEKCLVMLIGKRSPRS